MTKLNISERNAGDVTILNMDGDITFGEGNIELRRTIRLLLGESKNKILLNFSGVRYVDSSGIGEMVSGLTAINRENGQLKFSNLSQRLRELLTITKLTSVFEIFEEESEALDSYE